MTISGFPDLSGADWQPTRDSMKQYARVVGIVRRALAPPEKHWFHTALRVAAVGATTGPIPGIDSSVELVLDFVNHALQVVTSTGQTRSIPLRGQPVAVFHRQTLDALAGLGIEAAVDPNQFSDDSPLTYVPEQARRLWSAFSLVNLTLARFKGSLREETGPLVLWPHNFDLAFLWFSGRKVPNQYLANPEYADEQMNFGFEPGDAGIPEPYFYCPAYPMPDGLAGSPLPGGRTWQTEGWTGALLRYVELLKYDDPAGHLLAFLIAAHRAGSKQMTG
ncbi:MAG: DUF5996 family protein [Anaerolineae bacterium]|nr:DUF5996 family protein [Anaerolineae bacterium]